MANLNIKTALTGGSINCVDRNVAGMKVGGSVCWAFVSGVMMCYKFDSSSTATADGVNVIIPFGQSAGTAGRWIHFPTKYLKNAESETDITISASGKGIVFSDGTKIVFTSGAGLKIIPNNDNYPLLIRNSDDDATVAKFKEGEVEIKGLVAPTADSDPARKSDVDGNAAKISWVKVTASLLGNQGSFDLNGLSGYRKLRLTFFMLPQTDNVKLYLRTSTDNGISFDAGGSDYSWRVYDSSGATTDYLDSEITLCESGVGNGEAEGIWGQILLQQFNQDEYMRMIFNGGYCRASDGDDLPIIASGRRKESSGRDAFSLFFATGNIASGHILVEGAS